MGKNVDIKKISRQIFPNHTELGAYNQLAGKIGRRPLNQKEYDELKRTKRRPDSEINSENKTRNMAKNIIRLTESDLHRIVKESVKRVLREASREMPLRNKFGEPLDTGGFYYPEDYENTDSWVDDSYRKYNKLIADINDGMYDDQMDRIWELDPVDYFNLDIDSGTNWKQVVYAVKQRKKFLDGVTR